MLRFDDYLGVAKSWSDVTLQWLEASAQSFHVHAAQLRAERNGLLTDSGLTRREANTGQTPTASWYKQPPGARLNPIGLGWAGFCRSTRRHSMPRRCFGPFNPVEAWTKAMELAVPSMTVGIACACDQPSAPCELASGRHALDDRARCRDGGPCSGSRCALPKTPSSRLIARKVVTRVAQITFPNQVVAAVAVPENAILHAGRVLPLASDGPLMLTEPAHDRRARKSVRHFDLLGGSDLPKPTALAWPGNRPLPPCRLSASLRRPSCTRPWRCKPPAPDLCTEMPSIIGLSCERDHAESDCACSQAFRQHTDTHSSSPRYAQRGSS